MRSIKSIRVEWLKYFTGWGAYLTHRSDGAAITSVNLSMDKIFHRYANRSVRKEFYGHINNS